MLSVSALNTPALSSMVASATSPLVAAASTMFSPSAHPFMRRVLAAPTHFSFDPYKAVRAQMGFVMPSPVKAKQQQIVVKPAASAGSFIVTSPSAVARVAATAAPIAKSLPFRVVTIALKQGAAKFRAPFRLVEGDVVVIEGDRGEHIGTVKMVHSATETEALVTAKAVAGKIIRRATAADLEVLEAKTRKEEATLAEVSRIAKDVRLNASIADVEYQFDNNKLTIYVDRASSSTFVDFRKVQRTLFKMFHCRIWFVYMDELTH